MLHKSLRRKILIILTPMRHRIVRINIQSYKSCPDGPLLNNMLLPLDKLGAILKQTVINLNRMSNEHIQGCIKRERILRKISKQGTESLLRECFTENPLSN